MAHVTGVFGLRAYLRDVIVIALALVCVWSIGLSASLSIEADGVRAPVMLVTAMPEETVTEIIEAHKGRRLTMEASLFGHFAYFPDGAPRAALTEAGVWAVWDGWGVAALCGGILG